MALEILWITLNIIVATFSVTTNLLVFISIYRKGQFENPTNIFIGHLAIADILVGLFMVPSIVQRILKTELAFFECLSMFSLTLMAGNTSIIMLLCVTGERFIAIRFPFHYHTMVDSTNTYYFLGIVWTVCLSFGFVPYYWNCGKDNYDKCEFLNVITMNYLFYFNFLIVNGVPVITIACIYTYISIVIRRLKKKDLEMRKGLNLETEQKPTKLKNRSPFILMLIISLLIIPINILNLLHTYGLFDQTKEGVCKHMTEFAIILKNCNSIVNPFIYANHHRISTHHGSPKNTIRHSISKKETPDKVITIDSSDMTISKQSNSFPDSGVWVGFSYDCSFYLLFS